LDLGDFVKKRVLFLCTANSSRCQMAEGIVNHCFGDRLEAFSGGTQSSFVNPTAIEVMKEISANISHHRSEHLSEFDGQTFDFVITLCGDANETKADLINEVAKVTNMKKEASMAVEIFMSLIKKSLKGGRMFFFQDLGLSASLKDFQSLEYFLLREG